MIGYSSRLGCQINVTKEFEGIKVKIPDDGYWLKEEERSMSTIILQYITKWVELDRNETISQYTC